MRLTSRKFSFLLLFLATMVLAVAWLGSLRTWRECTVIVQPCTFLFSLRSGTAGVFVATRGASGYGFHPTSYTVRPGEGNAADSDPAGTFRLTRIALPLPGAAGHHGYSIQIPVWLPYLLFLAGTLVWLKLRGREADAATEKTLALREAAARAVEGNPVDKPQVGPA